ncbi:hypothetical protein Y1Q_0002941 [Alligator mississippiensis]|uniref:Uncharacterized protein n=1 Tax=Alligator mississippiensis TaxID=8496 RepID=A0A151MCY4_ALLMI|nr:hypothetical protein Y1Q_0002941 [Alligator mississippiensis]
MAESVQQVALFPSDKELVYTGNLIQIKCLATGRCGIQFAYSEWLRWNAIDNGSFGHLDQSGMSPALPVSEAFKTTHCMTSLGCIARLSLVLILGNVSSRNLVGYLIEVEGRNRYCSLPIA